MNIRLFFLICISYTCIIYTNQFLYPVAAYKDSQGNQKVIVINQTLARKIEVWLWDPITKNAVPALPSSIFTPVGLRMLADNSGFSFIDNGRIRIKKFNKRSPKAFDIYNPIYQLGAVEWIDQNHGYFCAKRRDRYCIFQISMQGSIDLIAGSMVCDCLNPKKIGSELFYIERSENESGHHYEIVQITYPNIVQELGTFNDTQSFEQRSLALLQSISSEHNSMNEASQHATTIADFEHHPIMLLTMISHTKGLVIEHPVSINEKDATIPFICHLFERVNKKWQHMPLFTFNMPSRLIVPTSNEQLCESILPLLPCYADGHIYFCNATVDGLSSTIFDYSLTDNTSQKITSDSSDQYFFAPLIIGSKLFYGGSIGQGAHECFNIDGHLNLLSKSL
ncbi:MAG TPA: hypothetical protein VFF04_01545 [Candidatus Babeliales bacterium]|nr:hypothetical protein [Candidatus Babeliales bacterium]